jgi:glyoxylase-like metal-dependent hydrolase (beta-lactamase superfamily II)
MEKVKIAENLFLFAQTDEEGLFANTYLLKGMPNIVVDAGIFVDENVGLVVLTHCHLDHHKFAEEYQKGGAKLAASREAAEELRKASEVVAPRNTREFFNNAPMPIKVGIILSGNQIIENGNFKLRVLNVPGHTPGSIALFDEEKQILFSGDTWYGGNKIGTWNHPGGDFNELQKSVSMLKSLKPKLLCPGHGNAVGEAEEKRQM